jgi:hypothetical protein
MCECSPSNNAVSQKMRLLYRMNRTIAIEATSNNKYSQWTPGCGDLRLETTNLAGDW